VVIQFITLSLKHELFFSLEHLHCCTQRNTPSSSHQLWDYCWEMTRGDHPYLVKSNHKIERDTTSFSVPLARFFFFTFLLHLARLGIYILHTHITFTWAKPITTIFYLFLFVCGLHLRSDPSNNSTLTTQVE
jgi:hypothetical protein